MMPVLCGFRVRIDIWVWLGVGDLLLGGFCLGETDGQLCSRVAVIKAGKEGECVAWLS